MSVNKKLIAIALFSCAFMSAVEITIVTTAIPSIVKDLDGFNLSSYLFSIYLLATAISTAIFGKLSDLYGRKKLLQISILIFIIGSFLCGISNSMILLIISRGIQGLGSGAINTLSMATIGDVFDVEERAKIQGYNSTVWSLGGLLAPIIGGIMLIKLTWHWVFLINIPVGLLSMLLINKSYNASETKNNEKLDIKGLLIMTLFIISIIQAVSGLEKNSFSSFSVGGLFIISGILIYIFYRMERNIEYPIIPFKLFTKEIFVIMSICFFNSAILIAMDVYNPSFMQSVQGYSPIMSTIPIVPMSIFWVLSSFILSKVIRKYSTKFILIASLSILALGCVGLYLLKINSPTWKMGFYASIVGLGFGSSFNILLFIVQETVSKEDIGIASGTVAFIRTLGQTLGISVFGLALNNSVLNYFKKSNININTYNLLTNNKVNRYDVVQSLFLGHNTIYLLCLMIGIVCVLLAFLLPSNKKLNNYS